MSTDDEFAESLAARLDRLAAREGHDDPDAERESAVVAALRSPAVWTEPPDLRAAVLARALATAPAAEPQPEDEPERPPATVTPLRPRWQRLAYAVPLAAAAAALVTFAVLGVQRVVEPSPDLRFAAAGQGGTFAGEMYRKPDGVEIRIDAENLPAAPAGTYYAAWLRRGEGDGNAVPIGSFHNRKVGDPIRLWSGVDPDDYPTISVTLQPVGAPPLPSNGKVVARGAVREG